MMIAMIIVGTVLKRIFFCRSKNLHSSDWARSRSTIEKCALVEFKAAMVSQQTLEARTIIRRQILRVDDIFGYSRIEERRKLERKGGLTVWCAGADKWFLRDQGLSLLMF